MCIYTNTLCLHFKKEKRSKQEQLKRNHPFKSPRQPNQHSLHLLSNLMMRRKGQREGGRRGRPCAWHKSAAIHPFRTKSWLTTTTSPNSQQKHAWSHSSRVPAGRSCMHFQWHHCTRRFVFADFIKSVKMCISNSTFWETSFLSHLSVSQKDEWGIQTGSKQ